MLHKNQQYVEYIPLLNPQLTVSHHVELNLFVIKLSHYQILFKWHHIVNRSDLSSHIEYASLLCCIVSSGMEMHIKWATVMEIYISAHYKAESNKCFAQLSLLGPVGVISPGGERLVLLQLHWRLPDCHIEEGQHICFWVTDKRKD